METFKNYILDNYLAIIGIVISTFFATYYYFKSKKVKRPVYTMTSFPLINSEIKKVDNLEVKYFGETVQNLTATKLAFWNAGNDTINKSDIPESAPLRIKVKEGIDIYSVEIIFCSDLSNNIIPRIRKSNYIFDFEYLDHNQGLIAKILHSGNSSEDLIFLGKVKGVGDAKSITLNKTTKLSVMVAIWGLYISSIALIGTFISVNNSLMGKKLGIGVFLAFVAYNIYHYWKIKINQIPKDLAKKFNE